MTLKNFCVLIVVISHKSTRDKMTIHSCCINVNCLFWHCYTDAHWGNWVISTQDYSVLFL